VPLYKRAVEADEDAGRLNYARALQYGIPEFNLVADGKTAFELCMHVCRSKDDKLRSVAQHQIGMMYIHGIGVDAVDEELAVQYWKQATEGSSYRHGPTLRCLGIYYGSREEYDLAFPLFVEAYKLGVVGVAYNLGLCYEFGFGVWLNKKEAFDYMQKAAAAGGIEAKYRLAQYYDHGTGTRINSAEAQRLCLEAAEGGLQEAQLSAGLLHYRGLLIGIDGGTKPPDYSESARYFNMAASQGDKSAMFHLALQYQGGLGVSQDGSIAKEWLEKSGRQSFEEGESLSTEQDLDRHNAENVFAAHIISIRH
jgi:TPR repeat protein